METLAILGVLATVGCFVVLLVATIARFVTQGLIVRRLRLAHPELWRELGAPRRHAYSVGTNLGLRRLMRRTAVDALKDPYLSRLRRAWIASAWIGLVSFGIVLGSLFLY